MPDDVKCYRREDRTRALVDVHDPSCTPAAGVGCRGCQTCHLEHCADCNRRHVDGTAYCPSCLAATRETLKVIIRLYGNLLDEAMLGRMATAELPGGDATVALGPWSLGTGDLAAPEWEAWRSYTEDNRLADDWHPLLTLEVWGQMWREWMGTPEPTTTATMTSAIGYLDRHLSALNAAQRRFDASGDVEWPPDITELVSDAHATRSALENVLSDGERQQSGAPCLRCNTNLIRQTDKTGGLTDDWRCPKCRRSYDAVQYRNAVVAGYAVVQIEVVESPLGDKTTWGTVARAAIDTKRSERTIRTWLREGHVARACLVAGRRHVVSIDDARRESLLRRKVFPIGQKSA